jgi:uncharacterized protein
VTGSPAGGDRDRDPSGRARSARARDELGRPLCRSEGTSATVDQPALPPADALVAAQHLLDTGQPFAAHEVLEAVWKASDGPSRELWRGLAQVAVGITHALRGNDSGARALLQRGADTLSGFAGTSPAGIDVDGIRAWALTASENLALAARPPALVVTGRPSGSHGASLGSLGK